MIEMILDRDLVAAGHEHEFVDAGGEAFLDGVLDQRPVDHRQHLLGHRLGRRQEARAQAGDRQDGFTDALGHDGRPPFSNPYYTSKSMICRCTGGG
jgi:hypothetical protein